MAIALALQSELSHPYKSSPRGYLCLLDVVGLDPQRHSKKNPTNLLSLPLEGPKFREDLGLGKLGRDC